MTSYDVVLVGGGHNGLVCATYLAKAGKKVLVLEANEQLGGGASTREFSPGFSVSACAHWLTQLSPEVDKDLALQDHGLEFAARDLSSISLAVDGDTVSIRGDRVEGQNVSDTDRDAYTAFYQQTIKFSSLLAAAFAVRAPKLVENNITDRGNLIKLGLGMKLLGREDMRELMRLALINMYDVMQENFDNEQLKALLSLDGVMGAHMGPRSPNTVFGYLYRRVGDVFGFIGPAQVRGGMGAVGKALTSSAQTSGVEIRTSSKVEKILMDEARVSGVRLQGGEEIFAPLVVSNADPVTTFRDLLGYNNVETGVARRVSQIRLKSGTAKLHLALEGAPSFIGLNESQLGQRLVIAPTMDYIERAFNHAKYGEYSAAPAMDISIPTINDSSLAPKGKHVLSAIVQFAPYELKDGWEGQKEIFKNLIIDCLAQYAPDIKAQIVASELLTPVDLESEFHMQGGHWHHGEISLDQIMMMRPFTGASQYGTPVDGLYLCGAGTHPGGGVTGLCGRNAAKEILKRGRQA